MAQSGGVRIRKYKDIPFSRKVVLRKIGNKCISFSDMNKIESKSEIEFLSSMTQNDVQKKIRETFPYLENKRFSCAAFVRVDNDHKQFESHGSQRVWDGETIKKHIKGKSNLYILEEEVVHSTSTSTVTTHDSNSTERTPSTSAHNIADSSHQSGGQANNINALLSGEQAVLYQEISELQVSHSEHDEFAMEVEQENQQEGASGLTNTGNLEFFHANGARKLQNSVIPVNISPLEQAAVMTSQQGFNVMPGCSTHNKYTAAAAPEGRVGSSDCKLSSSDDDDTPTSGISESDPEFSEKSEDNNNADTRPNLNSSDTGFDEGMDIDHGPHLDAIKNEEGDIPFSQNHVISMVAPSRSDGMSDETSDDVFQQDPLEAAVQDTCCMNPKSGSVEGGYPFHMTVPELPNDLTTAIVRFGGVANVCAEKLNSFTLSGIVPLSLVHGDVQVTAMRDLETGHILGMTYFKYVDDVVRTVVELVKDPVKLYQTFVCWAKESGLLQSDSDISESLDQDSSSQIKQKHLNILQLLVYTAAQTDAQQFLEMIFSTSAGQIVFNSYKDRTPLPEDIARANGHGDLAHFLQDINTRLSKETSGNVQNNAIDWLELVKAVQKQASAVQDKSTDQFNQSENDDNSSDYFADAETSSCGSFDHDTGWSDSEDQGLCIRDGKSIQGPTEKPEEGTPNKKPMKKWAQLDNEGDKENMSVWGLTHSFPEWLSKWQKREDTSSTQEGKGDGSTETNSTSKTPKNRESTPGRPASNNFQCTVTQNRHIHADMIELQMGRVRSWLACDLGQEEPPSEDGGGNTDETLNNGNHEANGEPDLQNQEQGHPAALSFNKGDVARADQHQDFNVSVFLTDNIDENGSITSETGAVEVSDECSSSSEEEFTTCGISEGNTDEILNTGNHEANGEPDLQNQEQGHPVALSFNKGNMARADQHQDSNIPSSLTDNRDDDGSTTASHETGQVEVSDVCSSSSEEKFTTSGISEGKDVLLHVIEEDTRCILPIADGMAQAGIAPLAVKGYMAPEVCIIKSGEMHADIYSFGWVSALEALLEAVKLSREVNELLRRCFEPKLGASQDQISKIEESHRYFAEAFARVARDCLEILKCSATLSLQKEACQRLHLLIRKYGRGNSQGRDVEREPTEQRAVGSQPSDEVNYAIVPRRVTATGFQKQSRGTPVSGLLLQELIQSETDPTKRLSLVKQSAVNDEAVDDSFLDCIDCFVQDDSSVDEHLNKLEDGVQQSKDVLLHVVDEDTRCIHPIADGMAQAGIVPLAAKGYMAPEVCTIMSRGIVFPFIAIMVSFVPKTASERTLQEQISTHRYLAEVFARDCLKILKCSATLSLQKEACQRLRLLIRKYCRSRKGKRERLSIETHFHDH